MLDPAVWYCIPSARPDGGTLRLWKRRGYRVAVQRDPGAARLSADCFDFLWEHEYDGYAKAVNRLCLEVCRQWPETLVCVTGGDDVEPDPMHDPNEISMEICWRAYAVEIRAKENVAPPKPSDPPSTYLVMQPTGDPWTDSLGRLIERVAGSPWMGRDWILKANGGQGPLWPEYWHFYVDEELQCVAQQQGVFWQRPDICQLHRQWSREFQSTGRQGPRPVRPEYLTRAQLDWDNAKAIFSRRKAAGFPGSEPK